ncbi:MAG: rod shape-determining protein [candidate division WOR-3 bacterium]
MGILSRIRSIFRTEVALDLGTAHTLVYVKGKGIVIREPSVVAVDLTTGKPIAIGAEAKLMLGKTHETIMAKRPIKDGVIENLDLVNLMISSLLSRVMRNTIAKPILYVGVPSGANEVELKAVRDAGEAAGAREVYLVAEPVAAAVGMDLPIHDPTGYMVVDIGGGTTEIAVISLGGIVAQASIPIAGDEMDQAIINYIRRKYTILIGEQTAEKIKITIGNVYPTEEVLEPMEVRGQSLVNSMPQVVEITPSEVREALREPVSQILEAIRRAFEATPPDLMADIIERGIHLTGGGALLRGMDLLIKEETGLMVKVVERPLECVAIGVGKIMENPKKYRSVILPSRKPGR